MGKQSAVILAVILAVITVVFVIIPFIISAIVYEFVFGRRFSTIDSKAYSRSDFPNLAFKRYEFKSKQGKKLVGYGYYSDTARNPKYKAVIIIAHSFAVGGHINYLNVINLFAENGFLVFGYDITGNDESEGKSIRGLPQGVMDLDSAISFVESSADFAELPILLFGHSWGGYSVGAVLKYHPEVKAVVSLAGFSRSCDVIKAQGIRLFGRTAKLLMPYVTLYEALKFGKYSVNTCIDGFNASAARVMIIHSEDDAIVPITTGFLQYEKEFADSERFIFIRFKNRKHIGIFHTDNARQYREAFHKQLDKYLSAFGNGKKNGIMTVLNDELKEKRAAYIRENFDKDRANEMDAELLGRILDFYDKSLDD